MMHKKKWQLATINAMVESAPNAPTPSAPVKVRLGKGSHRIRTALKIDTTVLLQVIVTTLRPD